MFWRETLAHSYLGFKFSHYKVERNQNIAVAHNRQWRRFITNTWIRDRVNGQGSEWMQDPERTVLAPPPREIVAKEWQHGGSAVEKNTTVPLPYHLSPSFIPSSFTAVCRRNSPVRGDDTVAQRVWRYSYRVNHCLLFSTGQKDNR